MQGNLPSYESREDEGSIALPSSAEVVRRHYDPQSQISIGQATVIATAIAASSQSPNVLVFGCGNDSNMWGEVAGRNGHVLFIENHDGWAKKILGDYPHLNIEVVSYGTSQVRNSLPIDEQRLSQFPMPSCIESRSWDVILVDAPNGHTPRSPGRSLPIYWSAKIAGKGAHIFIDDYDRPLEHNYVAHFIRPIRPYYAIIPRVRRLGNPSSGKMFWSIGV